MRTRYRIFAKLLLLLVLVSSVDALFARHIVGGEITYECIGQPNATTRTYEIKVFLYRDCFGNGALFDSGPGSQTPFEMSIFQGDDLFNVYPIFGSDLVITRLPVDLDNPCVIYPPDVCVESGVYTTQIDLPISNETYTVSYQRCCRNGTISNIVRPDDAGATYLVEISPTAQQTCNSSPEFISFPPIVICANTLLQFDHSAVDAQGDELRYRLGEPFYGGGNNTSGAGRNLFTGIAPNPESPPPYTPLVFVPGFTPIRPVDGGNPVININPVTGLLQVNPQTTGQFVLAIIVEEYRDGNLIGYVHRDFQFNIVECDPLISANVTALRGVDSVAPNLILVCGEKLVELVDISTDRTFIDGIEWFIQGTSVGDVSSTARTLDLEFPDYGSYPGRLIANPGFDCTDTSYFNIVLSPPTVVDFTFSYDTCIQGPVDFMGAVTSQADSIVRYNWDFGNGDRSSEENPSYRYDVAGRRFVTHTVRDNNGCLFSDSDILEYFPAPAELLVSLDNTLPCAPAEVLFRQELELLTDDYDIFWDFGNGNTSTELNPNFVYTEPGIYPVYVSATSPFGCFVDTQLTVPVRVLESPTASFRFAPQEINILDPNVFFFDQSLKAVSWQWFFDSLGVSREENPVFTFPDTGAFQIDLLVSHLNGCLDSTTQFLNINPFQTYFLPNAFTPNGDGTNELFRGTGYTRYISEFQMQIFNRWGELVFETEDIEASWDGRNMRNGGQSPPGVYLYIVNLRGLNGAETLTGYVTLVE
ncbi:MAG: PKD domain-containing protein [Saprospiraceae bacterium]